jgi:hypothetical protein
MGRGAAVASEIAAVAKTLEKWVHVGYSEE